MLSGEELVSLAETENRSNIKKIYYIFGAILDLMTIVFIILPLYGKAVGDHIYSVSLFSFTDASPFTLAIYWITFTILIMMGIVKLIFIYLVKEWWCDYITKCSVVLGAIAICFFTMTREPYVTTFLFIIFVTKVFVLIKQSKNDRK